MVEPQEELDNAFDAPRFGSMYGEDLDEMADDDDDDWFN